jgi:hypothetical protein
MRMVARDNRSFIRAADGREVKCSFVHCKYTRALTFENLLTFENFRWRMIIAVSFFFLSSRSREDI